MPLYFYFILVIFPIEKGKSSPGDLRRGVLHHAATFCHTAFSLPLLFLFSSSHPRSLPFSHLRLGFCRLPACASPHHASPRSHRIPPSLTRHARACRAHWPAVLPSVLLRPSSCILHMHGCPISLHTSIRYNSVPASALSLLFWSSCLCFPPSVSIWKPCRSHSVADQRATIGRHAQNNQNKPRRTQKEKKE